MGPGKEGYDQRKETHVGNAEEESRLHAHQPEKSEREAQLPLVTWNYTNKEQHNTVPLNGQQRGQEKKVISNIERQHKSCCISLQFISSSIQMVKYVFTYFSVPDTCFPHAVS